MVGGWGDMGGGESREVRGSSGAVSERSGNGKEWNGEAMGGRATGG